jgi:hypothetical protein
VLVDFTVVSAWPADTVELRWRVDGVEVPGTVDAAAFRLAADGLLHAVEVSARDVTGRIRAPDASEATTRRTWTVSPTAAPAAQKMAAGSPATAWLQVRVDSQGHRLLGRLDAVPVAAAAFGPSAEAHWQYTLLDEAGRVLASGGVIDPRIAWTALSAPGEAHAGHASALLDSGVYYVGIPQGVMPRKLRIAATAAGTEKLGGTGVPGAIELSLDSP